MKRRVLELASYLGQTEKLGTVSMVKVFYLLHEEL
jgi:hypothetical protein